ncbi:AAA family ATPase [Rhodoblastus acidophilus]|uniref:AAA family ATPase n=1 Tax=Rhodoblastus acidophilus TaxID=1074 RepID=A0A6N8DSP9_RHOAC|nr:ParA family protein [Rhodoblastus acidophilus]MTV32223.1 AAA family ATPase [Rhodoblastus acidophilus]
MRRIAMVTQKGGAGKSTLAICLGVAAREAGESVALVDLDPMGSLTGWGNRRNGGDIMVMAASPGELSEIMGQLEALGVTLAIIDTPAGDSALAEEAIAEAQLCLVPARPNIFDVAASQGTLQKLKHRDYSFVLNQCPPQRQAPRIQQGINALADMGVLLTPLVAARADYQEAARRGLGVTEFAASGAAAAEMRELWRSTRDRLDGVAEHRKSDAA